MSNLYRRSPIYASYQVSMHLANEFQRKMFFLNKLIGNKNYLLRPCLLRHPDEMSNRYRGLAIYASCQVSACLAKWCREDDF